ncbi:tyrosine-type recombinase/integrase [Flavobacterium collinsii]|uniref:Tyrosine recombinase XerC n=1 Tax=Flavobacterium collinsii TaxID=1114861 RepID=A0ABM8KQ89_9FLAO|nr:site-specific integrase [Flavobacterium collinsii]CAA9203367.1 Tyrosine recombinase XerC [Flavobacterium collinsii]
MLVKQFHYITKEESEQTIYSIKNVKHKVIVLLMLDAGLRITEACSIKCKNFDFKNRTLTIQSLKKRKKDLRTIPISNRLYQSIADYLATANISIESDSYLFPSKSSSTGHISRKTMWEAINIISKKVNIRNLHPHALRHSFATHHLSAGTSLAEIKEMLGHKNYNTTLIYAEIPTEELRNRVNAVTASPLKWYQKIYNFLIPKPKQKMINIDFSESYFTVGRNEELINLNANIDKHINTILIGKIGSGKTHLLKNIAIDKKVLRLDDTENIKKSLAQILLFLFKEKETVLAMLWKDFTTEEINKKIQRENTMHLCYTIISAIKPFEYCLIIDDITNITPGAKKALERLKDCFIIVAGAREIKAVNTSFLWNFEKVELKNLNRKESFLLINQLANNLDVENKELFFSHIFDQTNGNPRAISELINRYKKEPFLDTQTIREIRHTGALPEIDMTWIIIVSLGLLTSLRFLSREMNEPALRFIGGIAMILLFLLRPLLSNFRRKFL